MGGPTTRRDPVTVRLPQGRGGVGSEGAPADCTTPFDVRISVPRGMRLSKGDRVAVSVADRRVSLWSDAGDLPELGGVERARILRCTEQGFEFSGAVERVDDAGGSAVLQLVGHPGGHA